MKGLILIYSDQIFAKINIILEIIKYIFRIVKEFLKIKILLVFYFIIGSFQLHQEL